MIQDPALLERTYSKSSADTRGEVKKEKKKKTAQHLRTIYRNLCAASFSRCYTIAPATYFIFYRARAIYRAILIEVTDAIVRDY